MTGDAMTFDLEDAKKRGIMLRGMRGRIICSDAAGGFPVIAILETATLSSLLWAKSNGKTCDGDQLQNLPREVTLWAVASERFLQSSEKDSEDWCARERSQGYAAGYAPVTIKLTR